MDYKVNPGLTLANWLLKNWALNLSHYSLLDISFFAKINLVLCNIPSVKPVQYSVENPIKFSLCYKSSAWRMHSKRFINAKLFKAS